MAKIKCSISGIWMQQPQFSSLQLDNTHGNLHPIFSIPREQLYPIYTAHCKGKLSSEESYLLFLAFMHSTGKVIWNQPCSLEPKAHQTGILVEANIYKLLTALEQTDCIAHPKFKQPQFKVHEENCSLSNVSGWIGAMLRNVEYFYTNRADEDEQDKITKITNKLSYLILSGESPAKYSGVIANWADKVAAFPQAKAEGWKKIIKSCFSQTAMFNTPLIELKELKEYCECNIEVGSIHFHSLMEVLRTGIHKHVDYLGGSSLALGYTLLDTTSVPHAENGGHTSKEAEAKNRAALSSLLQDAPTAPPKKEDYPTSLAFLKAKLAYSSSRVIEDVRREEAAVASAQSKVAALKPKTMSDTIEESDELESASLEDLSELDGFSIIDPLEE